MTDGLLSSTPTRRVERLVRREAKAHFGPRRGRTYRVVFEHDRWWLEIDDPGERIRQFAVVDSVPGPIAFEEL